MGTTQISILHISDLHVTDESGGPEGWRRRRVLGDEWKRNLEIICDDGPLSMICFTGDLAQSGRAIEYEQVTEFIHCLLSFTGVGVEGLFVVPGNHDIDRTQSLSAWQSLRSIGSEEALSLSRWIAGGRDLRGIPASYRDDILERQAAYRKWLSDTMKRPELLPNAVNGHPRLGYRVELSHWPFPVHVIGLDSSWLAGDGNDAGKLCLTDEQVGRLASGLSGFRLAMVHHPLTDLADGSECRRMLSNSVDLLLRGHLHEPELLLTSDPDTSLRELAAGCLYSSDRYPNGCQRVDIELDERGRPLQYGIRFRAWSTRGFWHDEAGVYRNAKDGRYLWRGGSGAPRGKGAMMVDPQAAYRDAEGLSQSELHELYRAVVDTGLAGSRDSLLRGIDRGFIATIPYGATPGAQIFNDLNVLNEAKLRTGSMRPIEVWLKNAETLAASHVQAGVFEHALRRLRSPR